MGESNAIDLFEVASISQFGVNLISVTPVDGSFGGSSEEVSVVSSEGDWGYRPHHLGFTLDEHILEPNLSNGSISCAQKQVSILEEGDTIYSLAEQFLSWANSLEEGLFQADFNEVSSLGPQISKWISWVNDNTSEDSPQMAHVDICVLNLLIYEVTEPYSNPVVVNC